MKRMWLVLLLFLVSIAKSYADDPKQAKEGAATSVVDKFKANPGDKEAFTAFYQQYLGTILELSRTNPDEAEKKLTEMNDILDSLKSVDGEAKKFVDSARRTATALKSTIELERISLPELETQLDAKPDDFAALSKYYRKVLNTANVAARSEPEKAEKLVASAKERFNKAAESLKNENEKKQVETFLRMLGNVERSIESAKKMLALIGKEAAPLQAEAWVNGDSLTDADLKGKVVLLDFWAVWCGPCIATFPHLREWQEKYSDKGLVIIGLTNYYKRYDFDSEKGALKQAEKPLEAEAELEMLKRFAAHHKLHHRFAVQSDNTLAEFYGVTGIPHAVIIDQTGKIRMMKVGSGPQNAKDLGDMLESLLAKSPAAGGK